MEFSHHQQYHFFLIVGWLNQPSGKQLIINYMLLSSKTKRSSQLVINFPKVLQAKKNNKPHGKITGATKMRRTLRTFHPAHKTITKPPKKSSSISIKTVESWEFSQKPPNPIPGPCGKNTIPASERSSHRVCSILKHQKSGYLPLKLTASLPLKNRPFRPPIGKDHLPTIHF